jgi:vacuolar-type H+-ATPase subunit E/Vma4
MLAASGREFDSLEHSVRISTVGPAKREADVMTSRKMGEAVERILDQSRDRLRNYAAGPVFSAALGALLTETVVQARELLHAVDLKSVQGRISVAPQDVEVCRSLADQQGLACEIVGDDSVWGGVEFLSADKRYRIRNTLESRLARQESELRAVATKRIQQEVAKLAASAAPPE